ncbi:homoserine kinase [Buchnera aphidicola]|uniref:Homoserine kinase n=1 Tax=Buchnera aphidicola (Anoecia oenotherae) TaxID=1241833 RepID=A0A4D6XZ56_9GAMM|nr:homoserine kinase [Buchnera aphidicola]QCI19290.1 homoserine kinase [Buchnera aphidicola (Anoecia oenotherae)]
MVKVYAPASIGNINVGFDLLGIAISPISGKLLGDCVSIKMSKKFKITCSGCFSDELPSDLKKNIVWKCWILFSKIIKKDISVSINLEKNMPIGSGLGSSACSIVASLVAMNILFGTPLSSKEILCLMGQLEGEISGSIHYDNVAPCYLGGLQLIIHKKDIISQSIPSFKKWFWIIAWPGTKVSTELSRSLLPNVYSRSICIEHSRNLSSFVHASYTNQSNLAANCMKDLIAEPYRKKILPKFLEAKKLAMNLGALSCGISGSGPTFFSVCQDITKANNIAMWLSKNYLDNDRGFVDICRVDTVGARKIR